MIERVEKQREVYLSLLEDLDELDQQQFAPPVLPKKNLQDAARIIRQWLDLSNRNDFSSYRNAIEARGVLIFRSNGYNGKWQIPKESPILGFTLYEKACRKKGKLPGETIRQSYELEYGTDELEVHLGAVKPGERVLLVDDLLATGGTLEAAAKLIEKLGGKVESMACIIELTGLNGRKKLGKTPFISLISYDED